MPKEEAIQLLRDIEDEIRQDIDRDFSDRPELAKEVPKLMVDAIEHLSPDLYDYIWTQLRLMVYGS